MPSTWRRVEQAAPFRPRCGPGAARVDAIDSSAALGNDGRAAAVDGRGQDPRQLVAQDANAGPRARRWQPRQQPARRAEPLASSGWDSSAGWRSSASAGLARISPVAGKPVDDRSAATARTAEDHAVAKEGDRRSSAVAKPRQAGQGRRQDVAGGDRPHARVGAAHRRGWAHHRAARRQPEGAARPHRQGRPGQRRRPRRCKQQRDDDARAQGHAGAQEGQARRGRGGLPGAGGAAARRRSRPAAGWRAR